MPGEQVSRTSSTKPAWRRPRFRLLSLMLLVGLSACLFGLWRSLTARRPAPVSGIVTYQGKPLGSGVILFMPLGPVGRKATASVTADGRYAVKPGMVPGKYAVVVRGGRNAIPAKYTLRETSGLTVSIADAQANPLDIDLR